MTRHVSTQADNDVLKCLREKRSFAMIAGAGSGKTTSLVEALKSIDRLEGQRMRRDGQQAVCITYTNRATEVIRHRLRQNPLFTISTLHSFLWGEIGHFTNSIRESLRRSVIPAHIAKQREKDNGGKSKTAIEARAKAGELEQILTELDSVREFRYGNDNLVSDYMEGEISHDDLIAVASDLITNSKPFRRIIGQKYPYLFVDEAQDTSPAIVAAFNTLCSGEGLPIVGYFGDPSQQIYDTGMGNFSGPQNASVITKKENFRCSPQVINLLNAFRDDVEQFPAGDNSSIEGSVAITLVRMEKPEEPRGRYSNEQLGRAQARLEEAVEDWGWTENKDAKKLFLARRMIARRLGFLKLHDLFDSPYSSNRAKNAFEKGEHFLVKPFVTVIVPLVRAKRNGDSNTIMRVLTSRTRAFDAAGEHSGKTIREVRGIAKKVTSDLADIFESESLSNVLRFCGENGLFHTGERLKNHLERPKRIETYDEAKHGQERSDWLADAFFDLKGSDVENYCSFLDENTPYSTQHGVKGEEYDDVIVVFDDAEASWSHYTFAKLLTPQSAGEANDSQMERTRKLAYVCFSRAVRNLRVLLFTPDPEIAEEELSANGLFQKPQIKILG